MDNSQSRTTTAKIIAGLVILAAIVILYVLFASNNKKQGTPTAANTQSSSQSENSSPNTSSTSSPFSDGTYSASATYRTPRSTESITVNLTLAGDTVTAVDISQVPSEEEAALYQNEFKQGYKSQVVGKKLSDIHLSRVSGSSLTSEGFNDAIDQIEQKAKIAS